MIVDARNLATLKIHFTRLNEVEIEIEIEITYQTDIHSECLQRYISSSANRSNMFKSGVIVGL